VRGYFARMRGRGESPPRVPLAEIARSFLGAFAGIAALGLAHGQARSLLEAALLFGPLGASAVLLFAMPKSPLAQPRNVVGGHVLSALVGVAAVQWTPGPLWLTAALATACAIALMLATRTLHPPGGATALVAVLTGAHWNHALFPAGAGALVLVLAAVLVNNALPGRKYPEYWW